MALLVLCYVCYYLRVKDTLLYGKASLMTMRLYKIMNYSLASPLSTSLYLCLCTILLSLSFSFSFSLPLSAHIFSFRQLLFSFYSLCFSLFHFSMAQDCIYSCTYVVCVTSNPVSGHSLPWRQCLDLEGEIDLNLDFVLATDLNGSGILKWKHFLNYSMLLSICLISFIFIPLLHCNKITNLTNMGFFMIFHELVPAFIARF